MTAARQELSKAAVAGTDGRQQGGKDFSNGGSSKGESPEGESSKGASWLRLGKGRGDTRGMRRNLFSLYRESFSEESESEAAFEMQPLAQYTDEEKSGGMEKKLTDKGKAVYRDPWVAHNQGVGAEKKRQEVEPKQDEGEASDLSGALANLRLACDEYQEELTQKQKPKKKQKQKLEQAKRRRERPSPYHEAEDGWMVVREDLDVWDFTEEIGCVLPD
ncbi:hypothetical protein MKX08_005128 [Trichoderma sp. CBMAI-0020]|nr:hypothetical protein MKX08_005128 [Trichoderma sp. CBMAI-0020]